VTLAFAAGVLLMILPATLLRKAPQPDLAPRQTVRLSEPDGVEVYMLNTPRGTSQTPEISLPSRPHLMVFLLDQQPDPAIPSYTARLLDSDGKLVWHQDDVKPGQRSTFAVGVRSDLLHPGEYSLTLAPLGSYRFRVVSKTP
jgi:hypothetical protein